MIRKLKGYKLSEQTDIDLDDIFDYTQFRHGFNQAVKYLTNLDVVFKSLVINPEIGGKRNELKIDLYSISELEHTFFYRIQKDHIRIVRVLHGSKDIPSHF